MFLPALAKIYSEVATPGQTNLVHSTDLPTTRRFTQLGASSIEDPTPDRRGNIWRLLEEKCKTGNVELKARDIESLWACEECLTPACNKLARFAFGYLETKDAPAVFAMLYLAMNNDRPIDRMIFWAFYVIGFASAAIVVLQIIYRGILLILLS
jgi:hypothetical protein